MNLLERFQSFFGASPGQFCPGNTGLSRTLARLCRDALASQQPDLFDYFREWHSHDDAHEGPPYGLVKTAMYLQRIGQWEASWLLLQVHADQTQKQEIAATTRLNKGDPLCGLAILGRDYPSPAVAQHYAQLSSAGDVYYMHAIPDLEHGGFAPTIMERYESSARHFIWRERIAQRLSESTSAPLYLEPFLAARWFSAASAEHFFSLASPLDTTGKPFVEVLLDAVENPPVSTSAFTPGTRFEAAAGLLLSSTPGFEVREARRTNEKQIDLVVQYQRDRLCKLPLSEGPGIVECKSTADKVSCAELRDFGMKCVLLQVKFGILVARTGIAGAGSLFDEPTHAELIRRQFIAQGLTILVVNLSQLRNKSRELRGLQDELSLDHDLLVFGPIAEATKDG